MPTGGKHKAKGATKKSSRGQDSFKMASARRLSRLKNLKKPYEIIKAELKEPSYMTDLNWPKKGKNSPYENSQSLVKPQEVKSLKPKIPELQPLETTTEVYDYSYLYENYPDYQDYDYQQNNYFANPDPSDVSSLPPRPPVKQIPTEPIKQGTKTI